VIFFKGILVGLLMAVPVGPVGVLCIERTLHKGRHAGWITGLGAATADGFYAAVAAFGISFISDFVATHDLIFRLVGGLLIIWLGMTSLLGAKPTKVPAWEKKFEKTSSYFSSLLFTLTNPTTIFSFGIVFALTGFQASQTHTLLEPSLLVIGVALGSALWFLTLSHGAHYLARRVKNFSIGIVKRVAGIIILIFGLVILSGLKL
jgi:threonine/homoserine/homoserine lactone efflux protein